MENRFKKIFLFSIALLFTTILFSLSKGSVSISIRDILETFLLRINGEDGGKAASIIFSIRIPRILIGVLTGAALSISGLSLQTLFKNPLADPFVLGISSAAAFGAAIGIVLDFNLFGKYSIVVFAFGASLLALLFILYIGGKNVNPNTTILSGIVIGQMFSAGLSFLIIYNHESMEKIIFWTMGSLASIYYQDIALIFVVLVLGYIYLYRESEAMNILLNDDITAQSLGLDIVKAKRGLIITASLLTATVVSFTGIIGFVGLIIPHLTRIFLGPDNRLLLPISAIWGGIFLTLCDTFGRTAFAPTILPIAIITAIMGGPFFIYLLRKGI